MKYYSFLFLLPSCNQENKQTQGTTISKETQIPSQNVKEQKTDNSSPFGSDINDRRVDVFKDITLEDRVWFSEAFQKNMDRTFNTDSALKTEPYPEARIYMKYLHTALDHLIEF